MAESVQSDRSVMGEAQTLANEKSNLAGPARLGEE